MNTYTSSIAHNQQGILNKVKMFSKHRYHKVGFLEDLLKNIFKFWFNIWIDSVANSYCGVAMFAYKIN